MKFHVLMILPRNVRKFVAIVICQRVVVKDMHRHFGHSVCKDRQHCRARELGITPRLVGKTKTNMNQQNHALQNFNERIGIER